MLCFAKSTNLLLQLVFEMHDGSNGGKRHLSELKKTKVAY